MQAEKTEVIRTGITGSTLKIIAMITMLIDHIGATIVLQLVQRNSDNFDAFGNVRMTGMVILYYVLRGIGRLAFPIFIFLLLEGFQYTLPQWDKILTPERRKELYKIQKSSKTIVKPPKVGRNDPCPCGSGKKYKKCCGANA